MTDPIPDHDELARPIYESLGRALGTWSSVDHALANLYATCVNHASPAPALHGYWAVASFEAKLKLADAAISESLKSDAILLEKWSKLNNRLSRKSKNRNNLAHGVVWLSGHYNQTESFTDVSFLPTAGSLST